VVVIRYEGPKGGPGMPEMLTPTSAIMGAGLGKECALITDGRFRWDGVGWGGCGGARWGEMWAGRGGHGMLSGALMGLCK